MRLPDVVLAGLEVALNRYLWMDVASLARLGEMSGKLIAVELRGLDITLTMAPHGGGIQLLKDYEGTPDTVIIGTPLALTRLGAGGDRTALFAGEVEVRGDLAVGQRFEAVLREIEIDWEEQLSQVVGDVAAHQVANLVHDTLAWGAKSADTLRRDLSEYLQEEIRQVPHPAEVEAFLSAVDTLRDDAARLEARIKRLRDRIGPHES